MLGRTAATQLTKHPFVKQCELAQTNEAPTNKRPGRINGSAPLLHEVWFEHHLLLNVYWTDTPVLGIYKCIWSEWLNTISVASSASNYWLWHFKPLVSCSPKGKRPNGVRHEKWGYQGFQLTFPIYVRGKCASRNSGTRVWHHAVQILHCLKSGYHN
jgi:hypothetical protein